MDLSVIILGLSFTLQIAAALVALRLILRTKQRITGAWMLAAIVLMAFRRGVSLHRWMNGEEIKIDLLAEVIACVISFILLLGFLYISRLIGSMRSLNARAIAEEAKSEAIIEALEDGITIRDRAFRLLYMNPVAKKALGDHVGALCYAAFHNRERICDNCPAVASFKDGKVHVVEMKVLAEEGDRYFENTASPIKDSAGTVTACIELVRDITERKRVEETLRRSREELEILVRERTAELTVLNAQLRNLSTYLRDAREQERTLIAREIHDELGQALTALKMDLAWLRKKLPPGQTGLLEKEAAMTDLVNTTMQSVKRIATELRPGILDHLGLTAAIEWQAEEFEKRHAIPCTVVFDPREIVLDRERSTAIFRIFQESLTNVARHAKASSVSVFLKRNAGEMTLQIQDDGRGITERQLTDAKSLGLIGIRERALYWGGTFDIRGARNQGTVVTVRMPSDEQGRAS